MRIASLRMSLYHDTIEAAAIVIGACIVVDVDGGASK
jgi:hypothetical protein